LLDICRNKNIQQMTKKGRGADKVPDNPNRKHPKPKAGAKTLGLDKLVHIEVRTDADWQHRMPNLKEVLQAELDWCIESNDFSLAEIQPTNKRIKKTGIRYVKIKKRFLPLFAGDTELEQIASARSWLKHLAKNILNEEANGNKE
jgi:hypothetical protein